MLQVTLSGEQLEIIPKPKVNRAITNHKNVKIDDEWGTPKKLFDSICEIFKVNPKIDVCATEENKKCNVFFSKKENGLKQGWYDDVWLNPPYSKVGKWIQKAYEQHKQNNITIVALIFNKSDTAWYNTFIYNQETKKYVTEFYPIEKRIRFTKPGVRIRYSAPYPSCVVIWRAK